MSDGTQSGTRATVVETPLVVGGVTVVFVVEAVCTDEGTTIEVVDNGAGAGIEAATVSGAALDWETVVSGNAGVVVASDWP